MATYFDDWRIDFEVTIFIDLTPPKTDIDLTKNQVQQIPVPLND